MTTLHNITINTGKHDKINIRVNHAERGLIDRAAKIRGKNRSEFILSAVNKEAEDTILDQVLMKVSMDAYENFLLRLDKDPSPNDCILKTMHMKAVWDK